MREARPTYRLQLTPSFGFTQARDALGYLASLGIGTVYLSPILEARAGSEHGYDVVDPTRLRAEFGGQEGFEALVAQARAHGLGVLVDVVPNHMALSDQNPWIVDVLARGARSKYADVFDIDRRTDDALVLPVLGAPLGSVLDQITVEAGEDGRWFRYHEHRFPIARGTKIEPGATAEEITRALDRQHYRLIWWKDAPEHVNYRRFFDINELICVRVEDHSVYRRTHFLLEQLVRRRAIDGVRIDHVDGLYDPRAYLDRLAELDPQLWILVEKILAPGESIPTQWPAAGTTGYDFLAAVTDVFIDPAGHRALRRFARDLVADDAEDVAACKERVLRTTFPADVRALVRDARGVAHALGLDDDDALGQAFVALTSHLAVYRTYVDDRLMRRADRARIHHAAEAARGSAPQAALDVLTKILTLHVPSTHLAAARAVTRRWQQRTGPAMAKGVEDTALYRDVTLVARNEVGLHPGARVGDVVAFHEAMLVRARRTPRTMNATTTHDTKRSEDVRARLAVLSEIPDDWARVVRRWRRMTTALRSPKGPSVRDELLAYQTIVGTWPLEPKPGTAFTKRIEAYMIKAAREAKLDTSWTEPDLDYEKALARFVRGALAQRSRFRADAGAFVERIALAGAHNALAQLVLKMTAPGVPDTYQGAELWDLRLVDPDNRGPVELDERARILAQLDARRDDPALIEELVRTWRDGRIKLYVTAACLRARAASPALYARGSYVPLRAKGDPVVAFARTAARASSLTIVPRLGVGRRTWGTRTLGLPQGAPTTWRDVFTGRIVRARRGRVALAEVFESLPVALLSADTSTPDSR